MSTDKLYIVQDLMDGGDLHFNMMHRTRLKRFDLTRIKWYAACCVLGLEEIHKLGFLHRDIKPANMLLGKDGYAKLADFGLCGRLNSNGHCYARGGTLSFMSPESRNKEKRGRHGIGENVLWEEEHHIMLDNIAPGRDTSRTNSTALTQPHYYYYHRT
jgi:serine/threonine protein kinase